jgi:hypothetical protein
VPKTRKNLHQIQGTISLMKSIVLKTLSMLFESLERKYMQKTEQSSMNQGANKRKNESKSIKNIC